MACKTCVGCGPLPATSSRFWSKFGTVWHVYSRLNSCGNSMYRPSSGLPYLLRLLFRYQETFPVSLLAAVPVFLGNRVVVLKVLKVILITNTSNYSVLGTYIYTMSAYSFDIASWYTYGVFLMAAWGKIRCELLDPSRACMAAVTFALSPCKQAKMCKHLALVVHIVVCKTILNNQGCVWVRAPARRTFIWGLLTKIFVRELSHQWLRKWFIAHWVASHYLNQSWIIIIEVLERGRDCLHKHFYYFKGPSY